MKTFISPIFPALYLCTIVFSSSVFGEFIEVSLTHEISTQQTDLTAGPSNSTSRTALVDPTKVDATTGSIATSDGVIPISAIADSDLSRLGIEQARKIKPRDQCKVTIPYVPPVDSQPPPNTPPVAPPPLQETEDAAQTAAGQDFLQTVEDSRRAIEDAAAEDQQTVNSPYTELTLPALAEHLERAHENLSKASETLKSATSGLSRSEQERFSRSYMNARDKAEFARGELGKNLNNKSDQSLFNLFAPPKVNSPQSVREIADLLGGGGKNSPATSADALVNRALLLNGLPPKQMKDTLNKLKLAENRKFTLQDGTSVQIPILHNGYILGGSKSGVDCSSFVSSALPAEVRKGSFTTLDFRAMWIYGRTRRLEVPPKYTSDRAELIKKASNAFIPLNIYAREKLRPGDLLVYRLPWDTIGHVFVIKSHDTKRLRTEVIEASQSAGTVRNRTFQLSMDSLDAPVRLIRPGLLALRLKPNPKTFCKFKDDPKLEVKDNMGTK